MAHSNSRPYPLPFPSEAQRTQLSSYSSLANALGTDTVPEYASRRGPRPLPTKCGAITDTQAIYLKSPPISNPSYPYPARNVLNSGTYHARTPLLTNGWCPSNASVAWRKNSDQKDLPKFPSWYDRLPQPFFVEPYRPYGYQAGAEFPAIHFLRREDKEPYSIWNLLTMDTMPDLVTGNLPTLVQNPDRWIKIKLLWPGYSRYPFEKRIPIKRGAPLTPTLLLMILAHHIDEFVRWLQNEGAVIEAGQERWAVTGTLDGATAMWKDCVITSLQHRTGSIWQPEIYYLRE